MSEKNKYYTSTDELAYVSLSDGPVVEWDLSVGSHGVLYLDSSLPVRTIKAPYNLGKNQIITLTIIQDTVGGARVMFDPVFTVKYGVKLDPVYKTIITFSCEGIMEEDVKVKSINTLYEIDKNQLV